MQSFNLPSFDLKIKIENGKNYIFDHLRKQYVRLTPEEYVRQHFIHFLIEHKHYPDSLLVNEVSIKLGNVTKRCDTVLYGKHLNPLMIIEYKSPNVAINQNTFDQIARYNMKLQVPWLIVSNGIKHFCCKIDYLLRNYTFLEEVPFYEHLSLH